MFGRLQYYIREKKKRNTIKINERRFYKDRPNNDILDIAKVIIVNNEFDGLIETKEFERKSYDIIRLRYTVNNSQWQTSREICTYDIEKILDENDDVIWEKTETL